MADLTQELQSHLLWPIEAKGSVQRWKPLGDFEIEHFYHTSLEDGRQLEKSITDANNWLIERRNGIQRHIQQLFDHVKIATDGKLDNPWRAIKFGYDIISFMQEVSKFEQDITQLIGAVVQNIGILQSMEANIIAMVQTNLGAIASLLHEICNWGLPDLPAIPNMFSDGIWNWNGFNFFPLSSFVPHPSFDASFAFGQCNIHLPDVNVLRNFPSSVSTYSGLSYGTPLFVPPLGGLIPDTGTNLSSEDFIAKMQGEKATPWYTGDPSYAHPFDLQASMKGSLPDPNAVISAYGLPPQTYQDNIVSLVPGLAGDVVEPSDPDYLSPDLPVRQATLRKDLVHYVTLGQVVASNYDPYLTSAWLFYVGSARGGRAGTWIANFQAAYQQYVQPSLDYLAGPPIPWNRVLPGGTLNAGPPAIPLIVLLSALPATSAQSNVLWKLSYLEAALLGYPRNAQWDGYADGTYVGGFTGTDLDYSSVAVDPSSTTTIILGQDEATYLVPCTFPSAIGKNLITVISMADNRIRLDTAFQSSRPQYRYTYDQFAVATQVDRFSQFWREFNGNLQALLVQDPYLVGFVCAYPESLDSAVDPLGDPSTYDAVKADASSRNRTWAPGFPLLKVPVAPVVVYSNGSTPDPFHNGWPGGVLDPNAFLARPDIQGQPISVQIAMLRCNQAAAGLMKYKSDMSVEIGNAITKARQQAQLSSNFGFQVESASDVITVPPGLGSTPISFDQVDFDLTGYVTTQSAFTIQATGAYAVTGQLNWGPGAAGARTVTVMDGANPIATQSTDPSQAGPVSLPFGATVNLTEGDVITVLASHSLPADQQVVAGSILTVVMYSPEPDVTPVVPPSPTSGGTQTFIAASDFPALTAVSVGAYGEVSPVDPTTVTINPSSISPPFSYDEYPFVDGVSLTAARAGGTVVVATGYGSAFRVPGAGFVPGGLLYAGPGSLSPPVPAGAVTQDFEGLVLQECRWIIVIGRAMDSETFVYEPHIPTRQADAF